MLPYGKRERRDSCALVPYDSKIPQVIWIPTLLGRTSTGRHRRRPVTEPLDRADYGYLFYRELRRDFRSVLVDNHHLLYTYSPFKRFAVLGLEGEAHSRLSLNRVIERIDPGLSLIHL